VEDVAAVMGELIAEGKILGWGQSQATEEQIRRAHTVTPLTAIQSEYSIMERMFEKDVIPACEELEIGFVPFSPLASGFLSQNSCSPAVIGGADHGRKMRPSWRFFKSFAMAWEELRKGDATSTASHFSSRQCGDQS